MFLFTVKSFTSGLIYCMEQRNKYQSIKLKNISSKRALNLSLNLLQLVTVFLQLSLLQISLVSPQMVLCNSF